MIREVHRRSALLNQLSDNPPIEKVVQKRPGVLEAIDPHKTRMFRIHGRMSGSMSGESMEELVDSIRENQQRTPAVGYRLDKPEADGTEVILLSGARRRQAAIILERNMLVHIIEEPIDSEKVRLMITENQGRRDYTPFELGRELLMVVEEGCFANAKSAIVSLGIKTTTGFRAVKIASIPEKVLKAWKDPARMNAMLGERIASLLEKGGEAAARIEAAAFKIYRDSQGIDAPEKELLSAAEGKQKEKTHAVDLGPKQNPVGQLVLGGKEGKEMTLRLNFRADINVKTKVLQVLKDAGLYK